MGNFIIENFGKPFVIKKLIKHSFINLNYQKMKKFKLINLGLMLGFLSISLSSCEAIGGIFKAGMWTGLIIVAIIIAIILYFVSRSRK